MTIVNHKVPENVVHTVSFRELPNELNSDLGQLDTYKDLREDVRRELLSLAEVSDGWDGEASKGPSKEIIDDALLFLKNWSAQSMIPEPELLFEGAIALQFYLENGDSRGGVEFHKNHEGVYAVLSENNVYESGLFNSNSISEIVESAKIVEKVLSNGNN